MSSLTTRTTTLIFCRITNYSILLLSPIFLVRIFNIEQYGQYREFILYALLLSAIFELSIKSNLLYFLPKYPEDEKKLVSQTIFLILVSSTLGVILIYLLRSFLLEKISYDFINLLLLYIFFFVNSNTYESYYLGKKRSDLVFYLSSSISILRMLVLLTAAYITRDIIFTIKAIIVAEALKSLFVFFLFRKLFTISFNKAIISEQLKFILPLGAANILQVINNQIGKLIISITLGVSSLALYTIGSYQIPFLTIVRSSVMDVLFPEMAQCEKDHQRLLLWQRANIVFCLISFPIFVLLFFYADIFINTLFTTEYANAVPIFQICLLLMLRQCFEMSSPIRAVNKNKYFITGNILFLIVNVFFLIILFDIVGILAPAISIVVSEVAQAIYFGNRILHIYNVSLKKLLIWSSVAKILICSTLPITVLFLANYLTINELTKTLLFSILYLLLYISALKRFRIAEFELMVTKLPTLLRKVLYLQNP